MKKSMINFARFNAIILGLFFSSLLVSCGSTKSLISAGKINTPGIVIRAMDNSFVMKSGTVWHPPFINDLGKLDQDAIGLGGGGDRIAQNIAKNYKYALNKGAKKVMIKTPYSDKELYGVLMFLPAISGTACPDSPVKRSYQISVPERYVRTALNGQVSVVYEYYPCQGWQLKTWILWMSDVPF